jgi:hypothetical protein
MACRDWVVLAGGSSAKQAVLGPPYDDGVEIFGCN